MKPFPTSKPFLLLQSRPEPEASDNEYEAFCKFGGLKPNQLIRVAMDRGELGKVNLGDYSGVILGGGPSNVTDPPAKKSPAQRAFEPQLQTLLTEIIRRDHPFLGACLGIGFVTANLGGVMSKKYAEPVGPAVIHLTPAAQDDPLTTGLPDTFTAFLGHKEACEVLPPGAVLLAGSKDCPVQMFRVGRNVYATQFHPELDAPGMALRIQIYKHAGYFDPREAGRLTAVAHSATVTEPERILRRFVERYAQKTAPVSLPRRY